ncbi:MAG: isochorismate synthase [Phormidesmis sp.]
MRNISQKSYLTQPIEATALLEACDDETSFFLATPTQTFLARGVRDILSVPSDCPARHDLPRQAMALLEQQSRCGLPPTPLVGAVPFDDSAAVHLFVPDHMYRAGPLKNNAMASPAAADRGQCTLHMIPEPANYMQGVEQAIAHIQQSALLKVVLSRTLELSFPEAIHLGGLLRNLACSNRFGYTYLMDLATFQPFESESAITARKLIGASPELLVRRQGMQVEANPLAGSAPRSGDPHVDQQRAEGLMKSDKDRREHAVVVEAIADILSPLCRQLEVPPVPSILQTDSMIHLSTYLRGTLRDPQTCALSLALALHPTPAVCGFPVQCAYSTIQAIEPFARRYFTGLVGWVDRQGDGEWAVTIRCGETEGCRLRLYAGAGVVAGSTAEKELAETSAKFRTMLKALGLEHMLEVSV